MYSCKYKQSVFALLVSHTYTLTKTRCPHNLSHSHTHRHTLISITSVVMRSNMTQEGILIMPAMLGGVTLGEGCVCIVTLLGKD